VGLGRRPTVSAHLDVEGISDPLTDPRLPKVAVMLRQYRHVEGIAVYSVDGTWRLVLPAHARAVFIDRMGSDYLETSEPITPAQLEQIAANDGVIYNLFVTPAVA
jgi:hypothetical protein